MRLFGGHVQQDVATGADADSLAGADSEVIEQSKHVDGGVIVAEMFRENAGARSEEHTSELQSQSNLVCRLLLEKKKTQVYTTLGRFARRVHVLRDRSRQMHRLNGACETVFTGMQGCFYGQFVRSLCVLSSETGR